MDLRQLVWAEMLNKFIQSIRSREDVAALGFPEDQAAKIKAKIDR